MNKIIITLKYQLINQLCIDGQENIMKGINTIQIEGIEKE